MKTPQTDDIARGNHVVPTEWAQQLERERDEAFELLASEKTTRNHIIKRSVEVEKERDEAREKAERYRREANKFMLQRDESQEKYATEATEHMLAVNKLCNERDEAREAFVIATDQMVIAQGKVREANNERDEAREEVRLLKGILDLIKKDTQ